MSVAALMKFSDLCTTFETTAKSKGKEKAVPIISFIKQYKEAALELKRRNPDAVVSFYPALRLMLPQLERERAPYGLKEVTIAKKLIKVLCLPPQGTDAMRLTNFRSMSSDNTKDFADAAYWVLRKHFLGGNKLSLEEVNNYLNAIAQRNTSNDPRGLEGQLFKLFEETSAEEQRWLIRIILKDVRLGIGQDRILNLYHPDAVDLFSTNNSLSKVCDTLFDPTVRLHEIEVTIFEPFRPMLSQRCDIAQFNKLFSNNVNLYVENKFDGERFQLHMQNNNFKYFSRNGYDYTSTYGINFQTGLYTPLLKNAFKSHVWKIILDGEMMGWNKVKKKFGSKGMDFDVKHIKADSVHQPCFCVFDILLLNEKVLTNEPLRSRLLLLDSILNPVQGTIINSHHKEVNSKEEILTALNNSMDREEEGIVFKDTLSLYKSNNRNAGWWKMKLEYFENVMQDLDLLVMGGYYGEGKQRSRISGFLLGIKISSSNTDRSDEQSPMYYSFARVASGLSDDELSVIEKKLGPHWRKLSVGDPTDYGLEWGKDKPDMWIPPNKSCVLQVRASELVRTHSSDFKTDYTLRFPRIQKIRLDKPYYDCLTSSELQELTSASKLVTKLSKRYLELSDLELPEKVKKTRRKNVGIELQAVEQKSTLLMGHEFFVLTGSEDWSKGEVETSIREHGGTIVQTEGINTLCVLVGDDHPRVATCKQHDASCDLVKLHWLQTIIETGAFKMFTPSDMLHTRKQTRERFLSQFDKYGDSYVDDTDVESILGIMRAVEESGDFMYLTPTEIRDLEKELTYRNQLNLFPNEVAYFDDGVKNFKNISTDCSPIIQEMEFKFCGGTTSNIIDKTVTIIVTNDIDSRKQQLLEYLEEINNTEAKIVTQTYIGNKLKAVRQNLLDTL